MGYGKLLSAQDRRAWLRKPDHPTEIMVIRPDQFLVILIT
jgi:hypothetical protein